MKVRSVCQLKVDDYKLLVTLEDVKTLRKAADILYISQPAVSQRLKTIENFFGIDIFIRTKKQLITTNEGSLVIEHARKMLKEERLLLDKISSKIGEVNGSISIGVSSLIGQTILPQVLGEYTHLYPNVDIQLQIGSSEHIKQYQNDFHIMVVRGNEVMNVQNDLLLNEHHYFIYPKNRKQDLHLLPMIEFQAEPIYLKQIEEWYTDYLQQEYHALIKVDQIATCKALLLNGVGVTVLPELVIGDIDTDKFEIKKLNVMRKPLTRSTYICYEHNVLQLPQVKSFIEVLKNYINQLEIGKK